MWNTWMEKAKTVAANIDKQINESVGLETEGGFAQSTTQPEEEENVWNDDFDQAFYDEETVEDNSQPKSQQPQAENATRSSQLDLISGTPVPHPSSDATASSSVKEKSPGDNSPDSMNMPNVRDEELEHTKADNENVDELVDVQQVSLAPDAAPIIITETSTVKALETASSMLSTLSSSSGPMSSFLSSTAAAASSADPMSLLKNTATVLATPDSSTQAEPQVSNNQEEAVPSQNSAGSEHVQSSEEPETVSGVEGFEVDELVVEDDTISEEQNQASIKDESRAAESTISESPTSHEPVSPSNADRAPLAVGSKVETSTLPTHVSQTSIDVEDSPHYRKLLEQLKLREDQLASKSEQLTELQSLWEKQEQELRHKIQETKDEAKKRILRAKERCEAAEARLKQQTSTTAESGAQQDQLIAALREEGEQLARKQSEMERAVRAAKSESRELREQLEGETAAKDQANERTAKLEAELKETKGSLSSARKGQSQAGKLESDLLAARSDAELKGAKIMSLEQQVKELKAEAKELKDGIASTRKGVEETAERETKKLRRVHNDAIADIETKLRTSEREAGVREDALRHEVSELRKRWQDAVRRADALSMDVQSSTAPLLRQLESMERQNRARAAAWAELENKLRSELEETVIQNEKQSKERAELKSKLNRLERVANEREVELKECKSTIDSQSSKIEKLEAQIEEMESDFKNLQEEYARVERLANEGVARVRSEMTQTVVDSEERYRGQLDKLEGELRVEREKRSQLESQVSDLLDNAGMIVAPAAPQAILRESKPKKLRQTEGQAEILAGALGFGDSDGENDDDGEIGLQSRSFDDDEERPKAGMSSFAALEQLSSRLKIAKVELEALRVNLRESENTRDSLVAELAESRLAKEKLPLFEAKVKELADDNREKDLELAGLRYDIVEVRELYRTQLNELLEEKAIAFNSMNGGSPSPVEKSRQQTLEQDSPEQISIPAATPSNEDMD